MKKLVAILMLAGCGLSPAAGATAQDGAMLMRGVHTTADISRRCQDYVNQRMSDTVVDRSRQSVFLACVRRLSRNENVATEPQVGYGGPPPAIGAPAYQSGYAAPPMIDAPVALPIDGAWAGFGTCSTDEGYGRRGSCDTSAR